MGSWAPQPQTERHAQLSVVLLSLFLVILRRLFCPQAVIGQFIGI